MTDATLTHEARANDTAWAFEAWRTRNPRMLAYSGPTLRTVWADAVRWVLERQADWENQSPEQQILELRLGDRSIYWPLIGHDPRVFVDCPRDGRVVVGPEGVCDHCLYDFCKD